MEEEKNNIPVKSVTSSDDEAVDEEDSWDKVDIEDAADNNTAGENTDANDNVDISSNSNINNQGKQGYARDMIEKLEGKYSNRTEYPDRVMATGGSDETTEDDDDKDDAVLVEQSEGGQESKEEKIRPSENVIPKGEETGEMKVPSSPVKQQEKELSENGSDHAPPEPVKSPELRSSSNVATTTNEKLEINSTSSPPLRLNFDSEKETSPAVAVAVDTQQQQQQKPPPAASHSPFRLALPPPSLTAGGVNNSNNNNNAIIDPNHHDDGFANVIRERTRQRRAQEDAAVSELTVQVSRLEAALSAESKRRIQGIRQVHETSLQTATVMEERLQEQWNTELQRVHDRLNTLENRMTILEEQFYKSINDMECNINTSHMKLQKDISDLKADVGREKHQRQIRENYILQQLNDVATNYDNKWKQERQERIIAYRTIEENLQSISNKNATDTATYENQLHTELTLLQSTLQQEIYDRHHDDQEIVTAFNTYTKQLQDSLAAATGSST